MEMELEYTIQDKYESQNSYFKEYADDIIGYWEKKLRHLIMLADQAQKEGNYELMRELDAEIEEIRRRLRLFNKINNSNNSLSR